MNIRNGIQIFACALFLVFAHSLSMDKKAAAEPLPVKKTLDERLEEAVFQNQKKPYVAQLLERGADVNRCTTSAAQIPIIFIAADYDNMSLVKLFLAHPKINAYSTCSYFINGTDDGNSYWADITLLERAGQQDKNDLLKMLIYLGHESYQQLNPEGFDDANIKQLLAAPHTYQFSDEEKKEYEDVAIKIGFNNGEKLKLVFTDLGLITGQNTVLATLAPLIGHYLGLGLLPKTIVKERSSPCDKISQMCTIS